MEDGGSWCGSLMFQDQSTHPSSGCFCAGFLLQLFTQAGGDSKIGLTNAYDEVPIVALLVSPGKSPCVLSGCHPGFRAVVGVVGEGDEAPVGLLSPIVVKLPP